VEVGVGAEAETKTFQLHNTGLCSINVFLWFTLLGVTYN
jgi:hypothetical protein